MWLLPVIVELELFGLLAWWIWKDRNDVVHGKNGLELALVFHRCLEWQKEFEDAGEGKRRKKSEQ